MSHQASRQCFEPRKKAQSLALQGMGEHHATAATQALRSRTSPTAIGKPCIEPRLRNIGALIQVLSEHPNSVPGILLQVFGKRRVAAHVSRQNVHHAY